MDFCCDLTVHDPETLGVLEQAILVLEHEVAADVSAVRGSPPSRR